VGGRAKPLESMGGKGFLGMPPAKGVPRRFLEMQRRMAPPPVVQTPGPVQVEERALPGDGVSGGVDVGPGHVKGNVQQGPAAVKAEDVATT
jgi:vacuolar protein sorting-associated protein 72